MVTTQEGTSIIGVVHPRGTLLDGREVVEVALDRGSMGPGDAERLFRSLGAAIDAELPAPHNNGASLGHFVVGASPEVWATIDGLPNVHLAPLVQARAA